MVVFLYSVPFFTAFSPQSHRAGICRAVVAGNIVFAEIFGCRFNVIFAEHRINKTLRRNPFALHEALIKSACIQRLVSCHYFIAERRVILHCKVQGKGVFVVGKQSELSSEEHGGFVGDSFTKDSRLTIKELQKTTREAGNLYANLFDLPNVEDEIYYIRQMHYINSVETSIEEFFIPVGVIPSLENINSSVFTFRDILSFYGIRLKKMNQALRIIKGSAKTRKMLNVPEGVAIMHLECDFYNEDNVIIAHSISNIRSDMQSFTVSMH